MTTDPVCDEVSAEPISPDFEQNGNKQRDSYPLLIEFTHCLEPTVDPDLGSSENIYCFKMAGGLPGDH